MNAYVLHTQGSYTETDLVLSMCAFLLACISTSVHFCYLINAQMQQLIMKLIFPYKACTFE